MDDIWPVELGKRIAQARVDAGLSQKAVAELLDRTVASVSNWERAERTPSFAEIRRMALATDSDLRWLMFGHSYEDPLLRIESQLKLISDALGIGPAQGEPSDRPIPQPPGELGRRLADRRTSRERTQRDGTQGEQDAPKRRTA
jgi:transcriptional regulator with XRE-family HTH domain